MDGNKRVINLVLLPATEPGDKTYGVMPERIEGYPDISVYAITFPTMVWYNREICKKTETQIRALGVSPIILAGFSKSGLGVWNVAQLVPDLISGMIIFDSPAVRTELFSPSDANRFYKTDSEWQQDQPICTIEKFQTAMAKTGTVALISGESFSEEMCALAKALSSTAISHVFLPRQNLKHHWQSGWIEEGLRVLLTHPTRRD